MVSLDISRYDENRILGHVPEVIVLDEVFPREPQEIVQIPYRRVARWMGFEHSTHCQFPQPPRGFLHTHLDLPLDHAMFSRELPRVK